MTTPRVKDNDRDEITVKCGCCDGRRTVLDALGHMRPCSRCNDVAFSEWSAARAALSQASE